MLIIARTTGVQTVVMNGNSNTRVIGLWHQGLGRNWRTEMSRVVVWKPRVTALMRRGEAGLSRRWHQKPETPAGSGQSPSGNRILCILALKSDIWWQQFYDFTGWLKMPDMKLQDMKMPDKMTRHENAGHKFAPHIVSKYITYSAVCISFKF